MRQHTQGLVLLIVMLVALWITVDLAGPVLDDALSGDDSALHAETIDVVEPDEEGDLPVPLTPEEVLELQAVLTEAGYDPGPIDGVMGSATQSAADLAIADRGLPDSVTLRSLTNRLRAEIVAAQG
jgi:peptidoglycan hydrolase-like protein with peptidoglycan-binding domain